MTYEMKEKLIERPITFSDINNYKSYLSLDFTFGGFSNELNKSVNVGEAYSYFVGLRSPLQTKIPSYLYLGSLHNGTGIYTGKHLLKCVNTLANLFGFQGIYLIDASAIEIPHPKKYYYEAGLSYMMLYKKGYTYYESNGFHLATFDKQDGTFSLLPPILKRPIRRQRIWLIQNKIQSYVRKIKGQLDCYWKLFRMIPYDLDRSMFLQRIQLFELYVKTLSLLFPPKTYTSSTTFMTYFRRMTNEQYSFYFSNMDSIYQQMKRIDSNTVTGHTNVYELYHDMMTYFKDFPKIKIKNIQRHMKPSVHVEWKLIDVQQTMERYAGLKQHMDSSQIPIYWFKFLKKGPVKVHR
jgi:hypothetical protein